MRLLACKIDNFGKLTDFSYDFSQGINVIEEENGWGKSTLAAFLKAMLYGFDTKKEAGAIQKERTLYFPWQGGTYGGELDFEVNGKQYRISRTFGKTEKTDSFKLYDLSTNLESSDYTENIGEELFDLDRASFKRSMYIAQKDCVSTPSDAINAKLGDLADNTNDINNYETAMTKLKDTLNQLSPTRATGSVKRRESILTQLKMELKGYEDTTEGLNQLKNLYQEKQQEQEQIRENRQQAAGRLKKASEESTRAEQKKQYDSMQQELQDKMQQYQQTKISFPTEVPSKETLENMMEQAGKLEQSTTTVHNFALTQEEEITYQKLEQKYAASFDQDIEEQLTHINQASALKKNINDLQMKLSVQESLAAQQELMQPLKVEVPTEKNKSIYLGCGMTIVGSMLLLLGVTLAIIHAGYTWMSVSIALVGSLGAFFGRWIWRSGKANAAKKSQQLQEEVLQRQQQKREEIQQPVKRMKEELQTLTQQLQQELGCVKQFLEAKDIYCEEDAYQAQLYELKNLYHRDLSTYQILSEKKEKSEQAKKEQEQLQDTLNKQFIAYQIMPEEDLKKQISALQIAAETYRFAQKSLEQIQDKCNQFAKEHDIDALTDLKQAAEEAESSSLEELNQLINEADQQLESIKQALLQYTNQINALQEQLDLRDEKEQELEETQEVQLQEKHKFEMLKMTQEYLQQAKEQFTARYMAPISNGFRKYYEMLTGDTRDQWMVDTNISVKVKEQGQLRETELLSAGWQDLIGICMRLALVDAMYQGEKPFLILDDPFVNLDDEKMESGMEMLKKVSQEYQTIYFTCHQSRVPESLLINNIMKTSYL